MLINSKACDGKTMKKFLSLCRTNWSLHKVVWDTTELHSVKELRDEVAWCEHGLTGLTVITDMPKGIFTSLISSQKVSLKILNDDDTFISFQIVVIKRCNCKYFPVFHTNTISNSAILCI